MPTDKQKTWLNVTLGVRFTATPPANGSGQRSAKSDPARIWVNAKEAMDARLNRLASALRAYDIPAFRDVADKGLFGVTKSANVALTVALIEYRKSSVSGAAKVRTAAQSYRDMLKTSPQIGLIDNNPFGVETDIASMVNQALDEIEMSL
jgi:hypothetical protein